MSPLRALWLALALWGATHPLWHMALWLHGNGADPAALLKAWQANAATTALAWDLTIAATALVLWVLSEVAVRRNWAALWAVPATLLGGVGFGLPLYLYLRARPV